MYCNFRTPDVPAISGGHTLNAFCSQVSDGTISDNPLDCIHKKETRARFRSPLISVVILVSGFILVVILDEVGLIASSFLLSHYMGINRKTYNK